MARRAYEGRRDTLETEDPRVRDSGMVLIIVLESIGKSEEAARIQNDAGIERADFLTWKDHLPVLANGAS